MTTSALSSRQTTLGSTQEKPPSLSCIPSRLTGRRKRRKAQLALIAEASGPLLIVCGLFDGTTVATAAKRVLRCSNVGGRYSAENLSSVFPCNNRGQNIDRAMSAISRQSIPAAMAAPIMLPTLVPATASGLMPDSCSALITPICASPRTAPPLRASPIRLL